MVPSAIARAPCARTFSGRSARTPRIFGSGQYATLTNTYEWTYWPETKNLSAAPAGWCLHGTSTCAQFFGGQTSASKYALMWQWSGGGDYTNGYGDFDQIDVARMK